MVIFLILNNGFFVYVSDTGGREYCEKFKCSLFIAFGQAQNEFCSLAIQSVHISSFGLVRKNVILSHHIECHSREGV